MQCSCYKKLALLGVFAACLALVGCASCGTCQGAEAAGPWLAVNTRAGDVPPPPFPPPTPAKSGPHARPTGVAQADEFATPPTDGPDPAEPTDEEEAPPAKPIKKAKKTKLCKTDGLNIELHGSGAVYVNSPGVVPPPQAPAQAALLAQAPLFTQAPLLASAPVAASFPLIPGPVPDATIFKYSKRIAGGLYYAATGKCPSPKLAAAQTVAVAAAPVVQTAYVQQTSMALVPQVSYAQVPVTTVAPVQYLAQPAATPLQYALPPLPAAAPQYAAAPSPQTPLASPQAPRKSLFGH